MGLLNPKMDELGVVSPHLRRLTKAPKMSLPVIKAGSNNNNLVYWFGWTVKSLEMQGERSVTGMDAERGVYVVTLVAYEGPMKDFIQANDVVLKLGETDVNNLDDLQLSLIHI